MELLKNVTHVTPNTRRAIALLVLIMVVTSIRVQIAAASEVLPEAPAWVATVNAAESQEKKLTVPSVAAKAPAATPAVKPAKKVWNKVNAPDLETKPEHSSEPAVRTMVVATTAYTSDPRETDSTPFTTANGSQVRDGIVAANFLKFGTRIRIPDYFGDKVFEVHDRMNARYTQRVDIWMLKKSDAYAWGVRNVKIEILP